MQVKGNQAMISDFNIDEDISSREVDNIAP